MKVKYFADTDTLYIEFRDRAMPSPMILMTTRVLDLDADGNVCVITFEHANDRTECTV